MKNLKSKIKKSARKITASFLLMTTIVWSFGASLMLSVPVTHAAGTVLIGYGPPNGQTGIPTMAPLDFMFSAALNSTVVDSLNTVNNPFDIIPEVTGEWHYFEETWGIDTMYRVSFMALDGLALSTEYTISADLTNVTDVASDAVTLSLGDGLTALDTSGSIHSFTATTGDTETQGGIYPPMAFAGYPTEGMQQVSPSISSITINFDRDNMDATTFTTSSIYLTKVGTGTVSDTTVSPTTGTSGVATIQNFALDASSQYRVYVTRDVKDSNGQALAGMPLQDGSSGPYYYDFYTAASGTAVTASYIGSNLDQHLNSSGNIVSVPTGTMITATFDNSLDPTTVIASNVTLNDGDTVAGSVSYDAQSNMIRFIPGTILSASTSHTFAISTSVQSVTGTAITALSKTFTTGTADSTKPQVVFSEGDNYGLFVEFNEPLNQTTAENKSYYTLKTKSDSTDWSEVTAVSLTGANIRYQPEYNEVMIDGLTLTPGQEFQITVSTSVTDIAGNAMDNTAGINIRTGYIMDASLFFGGGGMFTMDDMGMEDFDMFDMGMKPIGVWPMSNMVSATTKYFIDIPIATIVPTGGIIELKFPTGFDVTSVIQDAQSPMNDDFNGGNTGTITFAGSDPADTTTNGVSNDGLGVIGRTVIVKLSAATTANDFLTIDLDNIQNSSVPKGFETDGYQVEIKTKTSAGILLEALYSMPFFITGGGSNTISGTVTATAAADGGTMTVYLGSPMTGPMQATTAAFSSGTADYEFANLPDGEYFLFTDPSITIVDGSYFGSPMPESIWVSNSATADKDITLTAEDSGSVFTLPVTLVGNFTTGGENDNVDIFAGSPTGFRVKTVAPGNTTGTAYDLYLPDGDWMVGVGPAMPTGPMAGPPPMPDWMPPMPTNVKISGSGTTSSVATLTIDLGTQSATTVAGQVIDGSGNAIANAEVFAYQPMGGFGGAHTKTASDGSFTLKVPVLGVYKIGAFMPGLPSSQEIVQDVQTAVAGLSIVMQKPAYTISGQVFNANSQAVPYAPVWAYQSDGWAHADTMTDAAGNYILYVDNGSWTVEADAPGVGWMEYSSAIVISDASQSGINLSPSADVTWHSITGTVTINGVLQTYMPIRAVLYDASGNYLGREYNSMTDSTGVYTISAPAGTYRVDIWTPEYGEIELLTDGVSNSPANLVVAGNVTGAHITIESNDLKTVTVEFENYLDYSNREAFIKIDEVAISSGIATPTGYHRSIRVSDLSGGDQSIKLKDGNYFFFVDVPGTGHFMPKSDSPAFNEERGCIVVDGATETVQFALPDLDSASAVITISGAVSGPDAGQKDAWVWVGNPTTGFHTGEQANATTGEYSLTVPILSSGNYMVGADKPEYISGEPTSDAGTANAVINFSLTAQSNTIAGKIYVDTNSNDTYDSGEEIPNGWVYAEEITTGAKSHAPVDGTGAYSLGVTSGSWKVYGAANGYLELQYSESDIPTVIDSSSNPTGKNIKLTADSNWVNKTKSSPMTPASGGIIDDTAQDTVTGKASGTGVKITVPPNALGSSSSSGNISSAETSAVSATNSHKPFAGKGKNITAADNSGQPITNLDNYVDMEMVLYKADVEAEEVAGGIKDFSKLKTMKMGYWDDTLNEWVSLPTTKTAYHKMNNDTEWTMYNGTTTQTGFEKFIDDALIAATATLTDGTDYEDYKLIFKASTNHFSVFALGTSPDGVRPSAPGNVAQSAGNGSSITLTWDAVSTNADTTTITDLFGYAVYRSADGVTYSQVSASAISVGTETYTDSDSALEAWNIYYYKITAGDDDNLESAYSTALQACSSRDTSVTGGTVNAQTCLLTALDGYTCDDSTHVCTAISTGGGGTISSTPTSTTGQAAVTPSAGGTISKTNSDGSSAKVVFPANALSENATITVAPKNRTSITASRPVPADKNVVGDYIYNFTAVSGTTAVNSFDKAVRLTFIYSNRQAEGFSEENFRIHYWNETSNKWMALEDNIVDAVNNTVTATTAHFTYFAIFGTQTSEEETTTPADTITPYSEVLDGDIVQCKTSSNPFAVYIVKVVGDTKYIRHIVSLEIFDYYTHLKWENLKQVDSLTNYSLSGWARVNTGPNGTPGPTDKVYEINGDQSKHWINMTAEDFLTHGGSDAAIYSVNQGEMNLYTTGADVMSL